ncbi:MAG: polysaccharide deacetylase family protein, partial [Candidatus Hydrogenedentes bacterium]|nr:polysaccharide deacetylase family protein [Candidatus Hydrogenedentota bacterium]
MTMYVAAYDTESPDCLAGVREIVKRHEAHGVPATFFMVANLLERQKKEYTALLRDHPLFEIACHSYTHMLLRDTPEFGKAGPLEQFPREIVDSKARLEDVFGCVVKGFRPPVSFADGLREALEVLRLLDAAGYAYVSSLAWGPSWSLPALLVKPFTYVA